MKVEDIKQMVRDLRDDTPCNENSHRDCGCERFDEVIDALDYLSIREEEQFFHVGGVLRDVRDWWGMDSDEPNTWGEIYFLGKYIDSKGEKWDIGFQDNEHRKVAVLVYSNEAPCYMSPTFKNLEDAREQIARYNDTDYYEAFEEMINRAEAKGLIK